MKDEIEQFTLWTCLICGHIGCFNIQAIINRNDEDEEPVLQNVQKGHAYEHYLDSKHVYVMEIETNKVWDFSKENYVNRLVQNEIDGKLVEVGGEQD